MAKLNLDDEEQRVMTDAFAMAYEFATVIGAKMRGEEVDPEATSMKAYRFSSWMMRARHWAHDAERATRENSEKAGRN